MKKIAIFCGTFYFAPKALKQSICGMRWLQQSILSQMEFLNNT